MTKILIKLARHKINKKGVSRGQNHNRKRVQERKLEPFYSYLKQIHFIKIYHALKNNCQTSTNKN